MVEFLHQKFLSVAKAAGVIGHRRAVEPTGIADSVLTQDTVSLIRSALRSCLERLHALDAGAAERARRALVRDDYARAGKPQIWQASATERAQLINELFVDAATVVAACAGVDDAELGAAAALLVTVAGQDLESDPDDGGVRIRWGVAPERVISTVDVYARHGHHSRRDRYDGYKLHLAVDTDSDLLTGGEASAATTHDATMLPRLIEADPVAVAEVRGDTHYGSPATRTRLADAGIDLVAPASPASPRPAGCSARTTSSSTSTPARSPVLVATWP